MKKLALFASGNGTNVQQISEYFLNRDGITVDCVVVNKQNIYVIERAKNLGIDCFYFNRNDFYNSDKVLDLMKQRGIDYIILAGFLWLVPENLLKNYDHKIINIHPALLPSYGGKGMYGHHVHEAVIAAKEKQRGITIHYVNEKYDSGDIIFQAKCDIKPTDTPEDLAKSIHILEKTYFPEIIERTIFLQSAIGLAKANIASKKGGPFGAIIVKDGKIIAQGTNTVTSTNDPTAHAEVNAIRNACKQLNDFNLSGCEIYTSCEPCPMCLSAIYWARLDRIYYAAGQNDAAFGGFDDTYIYKEIALDKKDRAIKSEQFLKELGRDPFEQWNNTQDKIKY